MEYAARYVGRLLELKDALRARAPAGSRFDPPWTTINTGSLSGGVAHNVIASIAKLEWEMRPVQAADAQFVKDDLRRYCDEELLPAMRAICPEAEITTEVIGEVDGLEPVDQNEAKHIMMELTGANTADVVPFGTEAGYSSNTACRRWCAGRGRSTRRTSPMSMCRWTSYSNASICWAVLANALSINSSIIK